jgi:hypothetical protein
LYIGIGGIVAGLFMTIAAVITIRKKRNIKRRPQRSFFIENRLRLQSSRTGESSVPLPMALSNSSVVRAKKPIQVQENRTTASETISKAEGKE